MGVHGNDDEKRTVTGKGFTTTGWSKKGRHCIADGKFVNC